MARDTLTMGKLDGTEIEAQCRQCSGSTDHKILSSAEMAGSDPNMSWSTSYETIQCQGCKTVSFRTEAGTSEDYHHYYDENGDEQVEYSTTIKQYPQGRQIAVGISGFDSFSLPDKVRIIYLETSQALVTDQPVLTGIGLRALLETVCKDKAAAGKTLFEKLDDLVEKKLLTPARVEVLHQIRGLGNDAAHEVKPHSSEELALAMDVLDHLLEEVYVLPAKTARVFAPRPPHPALGAASPLPGLPLPPVSPLASP
jgi:hypothetical protein